MAPHARRREPRTASSLNRLCRRSCGVAPCATATIDAILRLYSANAPHHILVCAVSSFSSTPQQGQRARRSSATRPIAARRCEPRNPFAKHRNS